MARRRAAWTKKKTGASFRKSEGVPFGSSYDPFAPRMISREAQIEGTARDIAAIDGSLPERIRKAFRAHCNFDIEFQALMRFGRHAERSKLTDKQVADAFKAIKTEADAAKFRALWKSS